MPGKNNNTFRIRRLASQKKFLLTWTVLLGATSAILTIYHSTSGRTGTGILYSRSNDTMTVALDYPGTWNPHREHHHEHHPHEPFLLPPLPPPCKVEQLQIIRRQLPPDQCIETKHRPWTNRCSFSYASRCPDSTYWLDPYIRTQRQRLSKTAVFVGCNKAMDAVNALRIMSANPEIDLGLWRDRFIANTNNAQQLVVPGHCGQEHKEQHQILNSTTGHSSNEPEQAITVDNHAKVFCIEAMPATATQLMATTKNLGWQDVLRVQNLAMGSKDTYVLFPNAEAKVGVEGLGIGDCKEESEACQKVPMHRLDTFMEKNQIHHVDFLSIDVEGNDYEVLLGAGETLSNIRYLEFEYNWKGLWKNTRLSDAIEFLKQKHFVCYFIGTAGRVWRITDCHLDHYDLHFWSNVGCVNTADPVVQPLQGAIENLFRQTLDADKSIQY